ncbi:MAG: pyridoxamine 5'-phosphate oxidase family protein [Deltaproteobacteria bacterium]|nr:pyridoxamine 5'-phosphate oxidase family protein [Deltaproteobacteria bacterium]MBW2390338.1 pyridoxamine 5'-phosphate oxidase family protein [Deltaproteobacteria bacterium]MBW2725000.1 pyridoxamine 5'-phosphate oxidase family protein [Deltaproteobacteria bacterium]
MSLSMSKQERESFLKDLHVGVISIEQKNASPLSVPIWYDYSPEVGVWILTAPNSAKGKALSTAGRYTLVAQDERPPAYRYVSVEGPVSETRPADLEKDSRPMARRYFGTELGDLYVDQEAGEQSLVFVMTPERWRTVDYGKLGDS